MNVNWTRVWTVIEKEWVEIIRNKMIIWSMILIPLLLVAMIVGTDYLIVRIEEKGGDTDADELPVPDQLKHLPPVEALLVQMNEQYMFYLFMIPMMMPVYIAAFSIIGEKQTKTLEPLLATPVSTWELLAGKSITATAPTVVVAWISYALTLLGIWLIVPPTVFVYAARAVWILSMLLLSPLLALLSVLSGVIVSSRVNDPRTAQQVTALFVVPVLGISLVVLAGWIFVDVQMVLYAAAVTAIIDLLVLYFAVKIFQRETILTRWK
ncbi:MAG: ABC transporter permease subunit [Anaerolineae bacterium]|nr:ABC transporter permease subunit [Anaerolineae bacterium]